MKRIALLILACTLAATACTSTNRPSVGADEIAERSALPAEEDAEGMAGDAVDYLNLCTRKECDATALTYTRAFREAAILRGAVAEIEEAAAHVANGEHEADSPPVTSTADAFFYLEVDLKALQKRFGELDPGRDFESISMEIVVRSALIRARDDAAAALAKLEAARSTFATRTGAQAVALVQWGERTEEDESVGISVAPEVVEDAFLSARAAMCEVAFEGVLAISSSAANGAAD